MIPIPRRKEYSMSNQNIKEAFLTYCKTPSISEKEINDPQVFYNSIPVNALLTEMDKDPKYAEEALDFIAENLKTMMPYRACLSAFFIGLYGEHGVTSLYADRDLLDFFDVALKYVMRLIIGLIKASPTKEINETNIKEMFAKLDIAKLTEKDPTAVQLIKGLPQLCTAVLSRIATSRAMRAYLRNVNIVTACGVVGYLIPAARFVAAMLNMVEQQQILVLFPNYKIGFEVTVEEVDSNYLIFSLLQNTLAKEGYMSKLGLSGYKVNPMIDKAINRELGKDDVVPDPLLDFAAFNYYSLHPIIKGRRDRYLLDADYLCEGQEHIDALGTLDGRHILLADTCTIKRSWGNSFVTGAHPGMHPKLTIDRVLPKDVYEKWIEAVEEIGTYHQEKGEEQP